MVCGAPGPLLSRVLSLCRFHYDSLADDGDTHGCHSVVACFWLILYAGVPLGGMGEVVDNVSNSDGNTYLARVLYDLIFWVWVGILLFNIITGLIVDTFSSLREEANERSDVLKNTCFICDFTRSSYDDVGLRGGPNFDQHKDDVHGIWNYVFFYHYLKRKDPTEYNGVESYVYGMIQDQNISWLPVRSSIAVQEKGRAATDSASFQEDLRAEMGALGNQMQTIATKLEQLESTMRSTAT